MYKSRKKIRRTICRYICDFSNVDDIISTLPGR